MDKDTDLDIEKKKVIKPIGLGALAALVLIVFGLIVFLKYFVGVKIFYLG